MIQKPQNERIQIDTWVCGSRGKGSMDSVGHSEFPCLVMKQEDGMEMLGESELITPLVKAVQELSSENKELKDELNELKIFIKKKLGDE